MADLAFKVCSRAVESLTFPTLFYIMKPLSLHKNADTVNKSNIIVSRSTLRLIEDENQTTENIHGMIIGCIDDIVSFFGVGLSSKRTEGKQHCRKALVAVKKVVGIENFEKSVNSIPGAMTQSVIHKEILGTSGKSASFAKQSAEDGETHSRANSFSLKRRKLGLSNSRVKENNKSRLTEIFSKAAICPGGDDKCDSGSINRNEQRSSEVSQSEPEHVNAVNISAKKRSGVAAIINIGFDQNNNGGFDF